MRARLRLVALATTTMVALAFLVPLALLIRSVARDRALSAAQGDAAALAPVLAVTTDPVAVAAAVDSTDAGRDGRLSVFLADGQRVGGRDEVPGEAVELARRGRAFSQSASDGDVGFFLPVLGGGTISVVHVVTRAGELRHGVRPAWALLAALGLGLVAGAVAVADRLASAVVRPVSRLAEAARRLGGGDLGTRVEPAGPPEVAAVGAAFNTLAGRVRDLLHAERESVADVSHRLRTPLTVLRMQADALPAGEERRRLLEATDELERAVSAVIEEARRPVREGAGGPCDLVGAARARAEFWGALADEQGRPWSVEVPGDGAALVAASDADLDDALDALLGNVFTHTPDGAPFSVRVERAEAGWALVVEDGGPGFPGAAVVVRGASGGGSTGLGLDIARRVAELAGGRLALSARGEGGARVELWFPDAAA